MLATSQATTHWCWLNDSGVCWLSSTCGTTISAPSATATKKCMLDFGCWILEGAIQNPTSNIQNPSIGSASSPQTQRVITPQPSATAVAASQRPPLPLAAPEVFP